MVFLRKNIKLLAPAGDFEMLMAAIQGGADAIYFGVGKLNMRAGSAKNFSEDDLHEIVSRCEKHKMHCYLTLNTIVYDQDLDACLQLIRKARQAGIHAVIASDPAIFQLAIQEKMPVHISTQANISNIKSIEFYSQFADVMVLARELSLEQIKNITETIAEKNICGPSGSLIKIEVFIHGALCMAISGKCYLSLHQANISANKGKCRQICRRGYLVTEKESGQQLEIDNEYIMSPKDLSTIGFLDQIVSTGVGVLKIEGRGRSPEYVKTVTQCYNEALNAVSNGNYKPESIEQWSLKLKEVFNRGFWDGYYLGKKPGEWSSKYGSNATTRKVYIGKSSNYFKALGVGEFQIESQQLNVGDRVIVTGPTTGVLEFEVLEIRVDLQSTNTTSKGELCSIPVPEKIRRSDKLYKIEQLYEHQTII